MNTDLTLSGLVKASGNLVAEIFELIAKLDGSIVDSRTSLLGEYYGILLRIRGSWDVIARIETACQGFCKKNGLVLQMERSNPEEFSEEPHLPYYAQITSLDRPGILLEVLLFFQQDDVIVKELESTVQISAHTRAHVLTMNIAIFVPHGVSIGELRERFLIFCEAMDLDAVLEPMK